MVRECVEACLRLNYPEDGYEILVIDDGSTPPVPAFGLSKVRVIRQEPGGPATARNRGVQVARGQWIAFTDDDCRPCGDWLLRLTHALDASPHGLIGGYTRNALPLNPFSAASQFLVDYLYLYFENRPRQQFFTSNNMAASRDRLLQINGFDESFPLPAAEDRDLCDRWVESNGTLEYQPTAVVDHLHSMSLVGFLRQQYRYGRGARVLSQRRALRGLTFQPEPRTFYFGLFAAPFRSNPLGKALQLFFLLLLSQVANVAGFAMESSSGK